MKASGVDPALIAAIGNELTWPAGPEEIRKAMRLVPDDAVQMISAAGTAEECRKKVEEYVDAGATCPILYPLGDDVRLMIDTFGTERADARSIGAQGGDFTMRSFKGRDILSLKDFERDEYFEIFRVADELAPYAEKRENGDAAQDRRRCSPRSTSRARGHVLATEAAMHRLGGHVLGFSDAKMTRAGDFYQESLKDTVHMLEYYGDVIAMRHFEQGAPAEAAKWASIPVINCGDGWGEHPTQVLTDLYTIWKDKGRLDGLHVLCVGDMRMRTMHSILYAMSRFDMEASLVHPEDMSLLPDFRAELDARNVHYREVESVEKAIADADVIYMEPVVQPDYTKSARRAREHGLTPPEYRVTRANCSDRRRSRARSCCTRFRGWTSCPPTSTTPVTPRYWFEAYNGVVMRMALLALVLGAAE